MKTSDKIKQWLYSRLLHETDVDVIHYIRTEIQMIKKLDEEITSFDDSK